MNKWTPEEVQIAAIIIVLIGIAILLLIFWPYRNEDQ